VRAAKRLLDRTRNDDEDTMQIQSRSPFALLATALVLAACEQDPMAPVEPPPPPPPEIQTIDWGATAVDQPGEPGTVIRLRCEGGGTARTIWGTIVYTDDSSICTAAVHSGRIDLSGGDVEITIQPRQGNYPATTRRGVTSRDYGPWNRGFSFAPVSATKVAWTENLSNRRGQNDEVFALDCPAGGPHGSAWGTDVYTDDSSVCTAAVHAGAITVEQGGRVFAVVRPGRSSYAASTRNGVKAGSWGSWAGSISFR
jgi:hypothetical protein